jgi:hypothetical protein
MSTARLPIPDLRSSVRKQLTACKPSSHRKRTHRIDALKTMEAYLGPPRNLRFVPLPSLRRKN